MQRIERRVTMLRLSAWANCARGASNLSLEAPLPDREECFKWQDCTEALIAANANVNARDIAGYFILSNLGAYNANERTIPLIRCSLALAQIRTLRRDSMRYTT
jgi:hypothetical protein